MCIDSIDTDETLFETIYGRMTAKEFREVYAAKHNISKDRK